MGVPGYPWNIHLISPFMEPPMASFHRHAKTGTFTNSGNSRHRPCHRFRKRIQLLRTLPKNGITLPVDSHVYCCDPIFQYKLCILWLLGIFLKSARVISCTNDSWLWKMGEKNSTTGTLKQQWILVWIGMNAQIEWFSTTNAFLVPKCYTQLQRFGMMAMAWYGIRCKTQGHRFRMILQGISNDLFCYYVYSICLPCLNKLEGCLNVHCFERERESTRLAWLQEYFLIFNDFPDSQMCDAIVLFVSGSAWWIRSGKSMSIQKQDCFWDMSCFSHCWASWTWHFTASPCCAAIKTFDTHPLFDVLALLHNI